MELMLFISNTNKPVYINPEYVESVSEYDDETCKIFTTNSEEYYLVRGSLTDIVNDLRNKRSLR